MDKGHSALRTWAEVDLSAIRYNLHVIEEKIGSNVSIMAVVKANAYGHGVGRVVSCLESEDSIAFWGVANVSEARTLSKTGTKKPIFILGPTFPGEMEEIAREKWHCFISNKEEWDCLSSHVQDGEELSVHLAVNTGMGREGMLPQAMEEWFSSFSQEDEKKLHIEGIGSHMPVADEDEEFTKEQIELFDKVCRTAFRKDRIRFRHLSNSAGIIGWKSEEGNLVRPGLILYGHNPLREQYSLNLKRTLKLKSRVTLINELPEGQGVSYGRDYITHKPTKVATIGIGYADGYPRQLSNKGAEVAIHGVRCPLLGRVTMDQIIADVSALENVKSGDEVELFGDIITAEEVAEKAGTIVWDLFTGLGNRVTRIYKEA